MMTSSLEARDVRSLLRLVGELRELGQDPQQWRAHLASELGLLCGARAVVTSELKPQLDRNGTLPEEGAAGSCQAAVKALVVADAGVEPARKATFYRDVIWYDHASDATLNGLMPLYGTAFVRQRRELVPDVVWAGSQLANELFRPHDCDDFILGMLPEPKSGVISSMELFRAWGEPGFGPRECLLVELVHEELARDWRAHQPVRLTPRLANVRNLLQRGLSEKEVAAELDLSGHTVHDHVKALYRSYQVRSRGELLAKLHTAGPRRTVLVAFGNN
jgi:DNA-binding CsgD family transcriptional regulator